MNDLIPKENLSRRELALNTAGATKKIAYTKVVEKLDAKSITVDKYGEEHISDDNPTQLRAAELILRLHNDIKPDGSVTVVNNTVTISSDEFKRILEDDRKVRQVGQTGEIIDVEKYRAT